MIELDALDDLDVDPTQERQFRVQVKGVNEGGTVRRFDDRKGRATLPVGTGTRITNAIVDPSAKAPANLAKFREPDVPKKRERERERERNRSLHCILRL